MEKTFERAGRTIVETCSQLLHNEKATIITDRETTKMEIRLENSHAVQILLLMI
jgi:hypothetical protein